MVRKEHEDMGIVMTADKFIEMAKKAANECKTLYVMGCFGAPMGYGRNREQQRLQQTACKAEDDRCGIGRYVRL